MKSSSRFEYSSAVGDKAKSTVVLLLAAVKRTVSSPPVSERWTIPGRGDLSPRRRYQRRRWPAVLAVLVLLAGGGFLAWHELHGSGRAVATPQVCTTPSAAPSPWPAAQVALAVLNSTGRQRLAHEVATALTARGFRVVRVGNTRPVVSGVAEILYGAGAQAAAVSVAEQVPGATTASQPAAGLTLVLGKGFRALANPADVAAAHRRDLAAAAPRPVQCRPA
jgi:hypothetical protein